MRSRLLKTSSVGLVLILAASVIEAAKPSEVFQAGYREVLELLSTGDVDRALEHLRKLEEKTLDGEMSQKAIERLWTLKLRVIRDLIDAESLDVLVPIIVFHHQAAVIYRAERQPILAVHSRQMVDELTEFYIQRAEGDGKARVFAGWVFTSLAGFAQEMRSFAASRTLFARALERDPANEFAMLSLGVTLEMHAKYPEAIAYYQRILERRPGNAEARLRLALCHIRARENDTFEYRPLREIAQVAQNPEAAAWVRSLAFQELASLHMKGERRAEAEAWLRRGLEALPEDQNQRIQLAALLERRGQRSEAQKLLAVIKATPEQGDSPRRRYDRVPTEGLPDARATMLRMMNSRAV